MFKPLLAPLAIVLGLASSVHAAHAQLPTVGSPDVPNGVAELFVGNWSVVRPEGSNSLLTCMLPTIIDADGAGGLVFEGITNRNLPFGVAAADGATAWQGAEPQTAVWTGPDSFILYPHLPDGALDVEFAMLYERCEIWPRSSYPGAVAGDVAPFAGAWLESLPAERGAGRPIVPQGSCADPVRFAVEGDSAIRQTMTGQDDLVIPVAAEGDLTTFPNEGFTGVVIWVSEDRWHLHYPDIDGKTNWNLPVNFTRCPT